MFMLLSHLLLHAPSGKISRDSTTSVPRAFMPSPFLTVSLSHRNKLQNVQEVTTPPTHTLMRRLTTGIRSEKSVVRRFRRCAKVYLHKLR
jgi:hypothetical protein